MMLVLLLAVVASLYGQIEEMAGSYTVRPELALPALPAKGGFFHDPVFGTRIIRVTDGTVRTTRAYRTFQYGPTFNADNTRLFYRIDNGVAQLADFNPATGAVSNWRAFTQFTTLGCAGETPFWSWHDPDIMYCITASTTLRRLHLSAGTNDVLFNIQDTHPGRALNQILASRDDKISFSIAQDTGHLGIYVGWGLYDAAIESMVYTDVATDALGCPGPASASITEDGHTIAIRCEPAGATYWRLVYDVDTLVYTASLAQCNPDYSGGHGHPGLSFWVADDSCSSARLVLHYGATPGATTALANVAYNSIGRHPNAFGSSSGWVANAYDCGNYDGSGRRCDTTITLPFEREIILASVTDPGRVRRLVHHRACYDQSDYYDEAHPAMSFDGWWVAYNSNMGTCGEPQDLWIARTLNPAARALGAVKARGVGRYR